MPNFAYNFAGAGAVVADSVTIAAGGHVTMGSGAVIKLDPSDSVASCPLQFNGVPTSGMNYAQANKPGLVAGGTRSVLVESGGLDITNGTGVVQCNQLNVPKIYVAESSAPSALANFGIFYVTDVAGKTRISVKAGAGGTTADLVTEA